MPAQATTIPISRMLLLALSNLGLQILLYSMYRLCPVFKQSRKSIRHTFTQHLPLGPIASESIIAASSWPGQ